MIATAVVAFGCGGTSALQPSAPIPPAAALTAVPPPAPSASAPVDMLTAPHPRTCGGPKLKVHFYNVSQALAALVDLPDGRHILVDTGESAKRAGCGAVCAIAHKNLLSKLTADLGGHQIDLMWITHQHSDHIGGASDIIEHLPVKGYLDNGRDLTVAEIKDVRDAAKTKGIPITVVEPGHEQIPIQGAGDVKITGIAPSAWLPKCKTDRNDCSILLRIDYCSSSLLFTGDAEKEEEAVLDVHGAVTLLQVGHHGSETSSSAPFLAKVKPKYAVISAGKQGEGMNKTYCHPRASTVQALTGVLGGPGSKAIRSFNAAVSCKDGTNANWIDVPASDRLWATERDGDVVLTTTGDGAFSKE